MEIGGELYIHTNPATKFKSHYVVWKLYQQTQPQTTGERSLNRTM